jgi:hypothetical protein
MSDAAKITSGDVRDHLFISYSWDDRAFVDWLALKLTALGYRLWYDRLHLLGGEAFPAEVDRAIKRRTFRMLAVLSRSSLSKPNPTGERTLALNLGRERKEDFLIPLNVDNLKPTDLDWMTADLTFIQFSPNWASGLRALVKKLDAINAPRDSGRNAEAIQAWLRTREVVENRAEPLWANLLEFRRVSEAIYRVDREAVRRSNEAPRASIEHDDAIWTFERPTKVPKHAISAHAWRLPGTPTAMTNNGTRLLREVVEQHGIARGLTRLSDGQLYFPGGALPKDQISYSDGSRKRHVDVTGYRTVRSRGAESRALYHLAPTFRINRTLLSSPSVELGLRLVWFDERGAPIEPGRAFRLTRKVRGGWWNNKVLARLRALAWCLADGADEFSPCGIDAISLSGKLVEMISPIGFDEEASASADDADDAADDPAESERVVDVDDDEAAVPEDHDDV